MREIKAGDKTIRVKGTPLALLFYKQEFKTDLMGDLVKMQGVDRDASKLDMLTVYQMTWAMAKAAEYGRPFPSFESWIADNEELDIETLALPVMEEAKHGFFRAGQQWQQARNSNKRPHRAGNSRNRKKSKA